jgi:hypothetical protein
MAERETVFKDHSRTGVVVCTYNPNTGEAGAGESRVHDHPRLQARPCLEGRKKGKKKGRRKGRKDRGREEGRKRKREREGGKEGRKEGSAKFLSQPWSAMAAH